MKHQIALSDLEWQIMQMLWEKGVMSVKEVWQVLFPNGEKAYTTIQTYMDRIYFRSEYGLSWLEYPLFHGRKDV